jgi:hypothetical protein
MSRFFLIRVFALLLSLHVALHRVCIRTLGEPDRDRSSVPVGVREESRCCYLSVGLESQNAHAVIGTRCRRNE